MKPSFTKWVVVMGCFVFTATASSQSLVELAQQEKARRAEIAKTGKSAAQVIDAEALSRLDPAATTAIQVSGSSQLRSEASTTEPAELGRPGLDNPNRAGEYATPASSTSRARRGALGRGWSPGSEHSTEGRGWSQGTEYPADGRGWSRDRENPPGGRGWSDRPAADRGYSNGGDYDTSGRGWSTGGKNPAGGRGWSQR